MAATPFKKFLRVVKDRLLMGGMGGGFMEVAVLVAASMSPPAGFYG
jgi:hypothetical protein